MVAKYFDTVKLQIYSMAINLAISIAIEKICAASQRLLCKRIPLDVKSVFSFFVICLVRCLGKLHRHYIGQADVSLQREFIP